METLFSDKVDLSRYVHPDERKNDRHAAASAFEMTIDDLAHRTPHLSVNCLKIEDREVVASQCRDQFQQGAGVVALAVHKVADYIIKGKTAGAVLTNNGEWAFIEGPLQLAAFKHRPTKLSPSHCGVEFLRSLDELQRRRFARELAKRPRLHLFHPS